MMCCFPALRDLITIRDLNIIYYGLNILNYVIAAWSSSFKTNLNKVVALICAVPRNGAVYC